jgi:phosphomannomutase
MKKLIAFDMDDTLTESKANIGYEMVAALYDLHKKYQIAIISGCNFSQFENQLLSNLLHWRPNFDKSKLYLMPASGTQLYYFDYDDYSWIKRYSYNLLLREKVQIYNAFFEAVEENKLEIFYNHGEIVDDRESQLTFSMCGQKAPLEIKKIYDPTQTKRLLVASYMDNILNHEYTITVGGASSIDVSKKGLDKAFGMTEILKFLSLQKEEAIFIADAIFEGGNDYPVKQLGVDSILVKNPEETLKFIETIL